MNKCLRCIQLSLPPVLIKLITSYLGSNCSSLLSSMPSGFGSTRVFIPCLPFFKCVTWALTDVAQLFGRGLIKGNVNRPPPLSGHVPELQIWSPVRAHMRGNDADPGRRDTSVVAETRQIHTDYWVLWRKREAQPLSQEESASTLALTGFYCFSGHITLRMILIYYAQVAIGSYRKQRRGYC